MIQNKKILAFFLSLLILSFPIFAFAQGLVICKGPECTLTDFVILVQRFINFLTFNLAVPISVLMFAIAGVMMMTAGGKEGQIKKAKSIFWGVAIGLIIMLAAWIIVYTITSTLLDEEFERDLPIRLD